MRRNSKRPPLALDIAPVNLIDLLLLLLIFFITTTTFLQLKVIELNVPHAKNAQKILKQNSMYTLSIKENCDLYFEKKPIDKDALAKKLKSLHDENPKAVFQIGADQNSPHRCFIEALDIFSLNNIENISILTKEFKGR